MDESELEMDTGDMTIPLRRLFPGAENSLVVSGANRKCGIGVCFF